MPLPLQHVPVPSESIAESSSSSAAAAGHCLAKIQPSFDMTAHDDMPQWAVDMKLASTYVPAVSCLVKTSLLIVLISR
jgi:hypothetical protein